LLEARSTHGAVQETRCSPAVAIAGTELVIMRAAMLHVALAVQLLGPAAGFRVKRGVEPQGRSAGRACGRKGAPAVPELPAALSNGLALVRVPKAASSTFGGVLRRIGRRRGLAHAVDDPAWIDAESPGGPEAPAVFVGDHVNRTALAAKIARSMPKPLFVTMVRDPAARCLASYYFAKVGRERKEATDVNKIHWMEACPRCPPGWQSGFAAPAPDLSVGALLASYGFVGVTERFDESLLLLARRLGVGLNDILYVSGKVSGSGVDFTTGRAIPRHPPLGQESEKVQQAAKRIYGGGPDERFLKAANRALDRDIVSYGRGFEADLAEYRQRLAVVARACQSVYERAISDANSSDAGCLYRDVGCGQPCIDAAVESFQWH